MNLDTHVNAAPNPDRRLARQGLTVVEVLVCTAICAVLFAVLVPAIMHCRETAQQTGCRNRFRQVGIAVHHYLGTFGRFPANSLTPWPVAIGPFLEDSVLTQAEYAELRDCEVLSLRCPLDDFLLFRGDAVTNQGFNPYLVGATDAQMRDGWSNTILVAESESAFGATWISGPLTFPAAISAKHRVANILFADGSVRGIDPFASPEFFDCLLDADSQEWSSN